MLRHAHEHQRAVSLEQLRKSVEVVARRDRVQDHVEALDVGVHFVRVARHHDLVRSERLGVLPLRLRRRERDGVRAHRAGELDAHVAEPADAHHADLLAGPGVPVPKRRVGRDARAEQRRHGRELFLPMTDLHHVLVVDDDPLGVAA
jgi:hypothetical protein